MKTTLTRYALSELDAAIEEKVKEGWTLVWKGKDQNTYINHKYYPSRKYPRVTTGAEVFEKWIAVMKKEEVNK